MFNLVYFCSIEYISLECVVNIEITTRYLFNFSTSIYFKLNNSQSSIILNTLLVACQSARFRLFNFLIFFLLFTSYSLDFRLLSFLILFLLFANRSFGHRTLFLFLVLTKVVNALSSSQYNSYRTQSFILFLLFFCGEFDSY